MPLRAPGLLIFGLTYVLISARRLQWLSFDRPAAALLGAILCVVVGVLSPTQALAAVDGRTLLLLFGVMGMGTFLSLDGFFEELEARLVALAGSPPRLLALLVWGTGLLSALITNDAVCVLGAPLVVRLIERHRLPAAPFLLGLATAANTGSAATLVGNPQNMLCGILGGLDYLQHLALVGPITLVGLAINHGVLWLTFRRVLGSKPLERPSSPRPLSVRSRLTLAVIAGTALAYAFGADLAFTATAGFVSLMLLHRRDTRSLWGHIDWSLLLFFGGLFVVVEGLVQSGAPEALFTHLSLARMSDTEGGWLQLSGLFLLGSNLVSNVPFILVVREPLSALPDPRLAWELLAVISTFAGNLTLLGSVANIIVAEAGHRVGGIGFGQHLRVGAPIALATSLLAALWLAPG